MRAIFATIAILLIGAAYWAMQSEGNTIAPPAPQNVTAPNKQASPPNAATSMREAVNPRQKQVKPATNTAPPVAPPPSLPIEDAPQATAIVHVSNVVTRKPVKGFRWKFFQRGKILQDEVDSNSASLPIPRGAIGKLLIEADGMQPYTKDPLMVPKIASTPLEIFAFLTPVATATGVTLMARDIDGQPITNVRVDAFTLNTENHNEAWQVGQPLWARQAASDDGKYELPPLPPGEYGILLVATDKEGNLRPLTAHRQTVLLTGSNGYLEDVTLEPACALQLKVLDGNSQPFDPSTHARASIKLNQTGATNTQRKWTLATPEGKTVSEANAMPGKGTIWIDEPVPAGNYNLEIVIDGVTRAQQFLQLRANETQVETIYVR
jgi:hypothetical protein